MSIKSAIRDGALVAVLLIESLLPLTGHAQTPSAGDEPIVLDPFSVEGKSKGYMATNTISGTAMNTPLRDVPMAINVITSELISDMKALDLQDIMKMNSSITQTGRLPVSNRNAAWSIRGFRNRNVLLDGVTAGDFIPPQLIDRVEVVKGPNTLYGQSDPGGLVNIITKRPRSGEQMNVTTYAGSDGLLGGDIDINTHLAGGAAGLRLLTGYSESDGYRKIDGGNSEYLALLGDFKVAPNTTLLLNATGTQGHGVPSQRSTYSFELIPTDLNGDGVINATVVDGVQENTARHNGTFLPRDYTSATKATQYDSHNWYLGLGVRQFFNSHVTTQYNYVNTQQFIDMTFREYNTFNVAGLSDANHTSQTSRNLTEAHTLQTVVTFNTGSLAHRMLIGGRATRDSDSGLNYSLRTNGPGAERTVLNNLIAQGRKIRLFLSKNDVLSGVKFWEDDVPTKAELIAYGTRGSNVEHNQSDVDSVYITDSVALMQNRLKLLGGLRYVNITGYSVGFDGARIGLTNKRSSTSYQLGSVYDLGKNISLFGNTATAFNPNGLDPLTGQFREPETSKAYEVGFKFENLLSSRLAGSISVFDIKKKNVVRSDYNPVTFGNTTEISDDESKGVDLEVFYNLTDSWQIMLGYSFLDAKTVKSQTAALGLQLEGAAPDKLTLWTSYAIDTGPLRGLRLGGGLVHVEGPIQQFGTSSSRLVVEDGYTDISIFARYATKVAKHPISLGVNVSNLTDVFYIQSRAGTNNPRQITFTGSFEF